MRQQWRCPLVQGPERGEVASCPHRDTCSTAPSGRVFYTYPGQEPRLNAVPPRGTTGWQELFDHRTASERTNSRQKYHLKLDRTRGGGRWLFRMFLAAVAQYLLAWHQHQPAT